MWFYVIRITHICALLNSFTDLDIARQYWTKISVYFLRPFELDIAYFRYCSMFHLVAKLNPHLMVLDLDFPPFLGASQSA